MPCENCPENEKKTESLRPDSKPLRPEAQPCKGPPELCKIWKSLMELDQARMYFRRHMDLMSCVRCKEWAVEIITILDTYARMTSMAENYKLEKARLTAQFQDIIRKLGSEIQKTEDDSKT